MSKFLTVGREKFSFIVTPTELEEVLKDMHLLIISRHVPDGYIETPLCEYIAEYSLIYSKLMSGQKVVRRDFWNYGEMGIAKSLEKHSYGKLHTYCGAMYQLDDFDEPCAMMGYFPMQIYTSKDGKATLSISAASIQYPENIVGLELSFPKQIQYAWDGTYSPLQTTKDIESYQDFVIVRDRIKAITRPLRLMVADKEVRPRVRISRDALNDIDSFWFLQKNQIHVIK